MNNSFRFDRSILLFYLFDEKANACNITYVDNVFYKEKQELVEHPKQENMLVVYNILYQKTLYLHHVCPSSAVCLYRYLTDERKKKKIKSVNILNRI